MWTFEGCTSLTAIEVDPRNPIYSSQEGVLFDKGQTTLLLYPDGKAGGYIIPGTVSTIGDWAFSGNTSLSNITIPASVTNIGTGAFIDCTGLTDVYFTGNGVGARSAILGGADSATVYYLPGTTGWGPTYADRPTAWWALPYPVILTTAPAFGIQDNAFEFRISWATNDSVVVDAATDPGNPTWASLSTNALADGWSHFSDPDWANYPTRFYRVRSR